MSSEENICELAAGFSRKRQHLTDQFNLQQSADSKRRNTAPIYNNHLLSLDSSEQHIEMDDDNPQIIDGMSSQTHNHQQDAKQQQQNKTTNGYKNSPTAGTTNGTKKIVIRKFQHRNDPSVSNFDTNWSVLEDSIRKIQRRESGSVTCVELYNLVEHLCQMNYAGEIYNRLQMLIGKFAENECASLMDKCQNVTYEAFLETLNHLWEAFCQQLSLTRSVFLYLDRTYRVQSTSSISIWDAGLEAFRRHIIERSGVCSRTVVGVLKLIEQDRRGIQINKQLLKSLIRMFMNLQMYDRTFEREFLKTTEQFYLDESQNKIQELELSLYLQHVQGRISEEEERVHMYLEYSTYKKLITIVERCFISDYLETVISKGVDQLLTEQRIADLALMYRLLSRVKDGQLALKNAFATYIKKMGKAMVMDSDRDKTLVHELMNFKAGMDKVIASCFTSNERFLHSLKDSFDFFINTRANKIAELIAKFMDSKLRTGNKECSEEELDSVMDRAIVLFRFVQGKDIFEAFYKKDLAKRLLLGRSASVDAEKAMLSKLRTECGAGLTQKLEGMFKDMEVSKDFCNTFKQYLETNDRDGRFSKLEVNVNILTMGHWPNYPKMEVNIPPQLAELQQICAKFYTSKHNGRKLQWQYSLASGVLKANFSPTVTKELEVSLFQAMILLLYNERTQWEYEEIAESTKIDHIELKRTLQSLACGKFRVLHKQPKGKDVSAGDKFTLNEAFNDRLYRIRISQVQMRETEQEHQQTEEQIYQDRQYQIDAAVVRIMKTRKKLTHNQLITEVLAQLRFPVKALDLKKRIESLIEREYMTRDKEDANVYHYVA